VFCGSSGQQGIGGIGSSTQMQAATGPEHKIVRVASTTIEFVERWNTCRY
jgi:hypothetical protein